MQSKITDFETSNNQEAELYGDFGSLKVHMINGIAHAFKNNTNVVLTLYSDTGITNSGKKICSADFRIGLDEKSLRETIQNLILIEKSLFGSEKNNGPEETLKPAEAEAEAEILGPVL